MRTILTLSFALLYIGAGGLFGIAVLAVFHARKPRSVVRQIEKRKAESGNARLSTIRHPLSAATLRRILS